MAKKKYLIITCLAILTLLLFVGFLVALNSKFRVTKTIPSIKGTVSTSTNGFKIIFNRKLANNQDLMKNTSDPAKHIVSIYSPEDNSIVVVTKQNLENAKYEFDIKTIRAADGSVIPAIKFSYTAKYRPYEKLSNEHRELISAIANKPAADFPLLKHLPHSTLNYKLDVGYDDEEESGSVGKPVVVAELYLSSADVKIDREGAVARYKNEVLEYIRSLNLNPEDYSITYEVVEH